MKKIIPVLVAGFLLFSCSSENNQIADPVQTEPSQTQPGAETPIEILFDQEKFTDAKIPGLLKELNICSSTQTNLNDARDPACDPKFFHIRPFVENEPVENAFLLVIRAGVHDWPLRRLLVYQREQGKLVLVNTFVAHLIGVRKSATKHDDLVLQFFDEYENRLQCLYKWKENRYQYVAVEKIEGRKIKKELQDSMNVEIAKVIENNKMAS